MGIQRFKAVRTIGDDYWLKIYYPVNIDVPGMDDHGYIQEDIKLEDELAATDCIRKIEDGMKDAIYRK